MNAAELERIWENLSAASAVGILNAVPLGREHLWAALDSSGQCHLLVETPSGSDAPRLQVKGLRAIVAMHQVADREPAPFLDFSCVDPSVLPTFAAVAADIVRAATETTPAEAVSVVTDVLERWKWFWEVDSSRLTDSEALGLFGELWFLARWARPTPTSLAAWTGSDGSRHDFQWPSVSVEVKTTARRSEIRASHTIKSLDQLAAPETGDLYLFSLQLVRDQLAKNTLPRLVDHVASALGQDPVTQELFARKLGNRGYTPAHRRTLGTRYRVVEEYLYRVEGDFPRLTPGTFPQGLPPGIGGISYRLDTAACEPWLAASAPLPWPPTQA
ncbi:PD-(D/E)XK motif protein [Embleya hyalina]|uniref:PD-(D/E)XK motif protein n=1 Tax=Embleya hyalina TaxID=516124 RepID=A0A401YYF1_9ACTN|nr:PD-(D/E)XK motif protein [Embleya hyalina]GCD99649.1 hypothetical protein EHYA_07371 [Embleya hyalina]